MKQMTHSKDNRRFLLGMFVFILLLAELFYDKRVNEMNTTMLAFTYEYGFISRGLVGTVFQTVVNLLPGMDFNYEAVMNFTKCITGVYFLTILGFFGFCLKKVDALGDTFAVKKHHYQYFMVLYAIFAIPFSVANYNFGRTDIWLIIISLLCVMSLVLEKNEWITIPLCAIAIMIHQGFAFMFMNTILILLFYKILSYDGARRKKYILLFTLCTVISAGLFFWFEIFSHTNGENIYEDMLNMAYTLSRNGKSIHQDVLDKEILGIDLTQREVTLHLQNFVQFPIYIILMLPYIFTAYHFFKNVITEASDTAAKVKYLFVAIGSLTVIPLLLLKVDYGRWMMAVMHYYLITLMALIASGDKLIIKHVENTIHWLKQKSGLAVILVVYPILLQPFHDVSICKLTAKIGGIINETWLHWW